MNLMIEIEQEDDGRWIADIPELPGCMVYGETPQKAIRKVIALGLKVVSERFEEGEENIELAKHIESAKVDFSFVLPCIA